MNVPPWEIGIIPGCLVIWNVRLFQAKEPQERLDNRISSSNIPFYFFSEEVLAAIPVYTLLHTIRTLGDRNEDIRIVSIAPVGNRELPTEGVDLHRLVYTLDSSLTFRHSLDSVGR